MREIARIPFVWTQHNLAPFNHPVAFPIGACLDRDLTIEIFGTKMKMIAILA